MLDGECLCSPHIVEEYPIALPMPPPPPAQMMSNTADEAHLQHPPPHMEFGDPLSSPYHHEAYTANPIYPQPYQMPTQMLPNPSQVGPDMMNVEMSAPAAPYETLLNGNTIHQNFTNSNLPPTSQDQAQAAFHEHSNNRPAQQGKSSCCHPQTSSSTLPESMNPATSTPMSSHFDLSKLGQPLEFHPGVPETTMYHIPPNLATADNPLTTESQAAVLRNNVYSSQTVSINAMSGITGVAAPPAEATCMGESLHVAHPCNCGDACSCTACPVHPYNATMQAKVRELWPLLKRSEGELDGGSRPISSHETDAARSGDSSMPPVDHGISLPDDVDWGDFDRLSPDGDHVFRDYAQQIEPGVVSGTNHGHSVINQGFSSAQYLHYEYEAPHQPECRAPAGVLCKCADGCNCTGCSSHTGHLQLAGHENTPTQLLSEM